MMRKFLFGMFIAGIILLGALGQAGTQLLALPSPAVEADAAGGNLARFAGRGPHSVGVRRLTVDEAPVSITVWYPAANQVTGGASLIYSYAISMLSPDSSTTLAAYTGQAGLGATPDLENGPYPLVMLSPGFAITSSSYAWLAEHLASYGFVVVSPQHHESLDPGMLWLSTVKRPQDVLKIFGYLDEEVRAGGEFEGLIDSETVAVIGHSYGGYTALAAAGAQMDTGAFESACETAYETEAPLIFLCDALLPHLGNMADSAGLSSVPAGLWPTWADPRVDAVVSMAGDAAMFGSTGLSQVTIPVMAMGGTADRDSPFEWGTSLAYEHASSARKAEIALEDAEHLIFAGKCATVRRILRLVSTDFCSDPAWDRDRAHALIAHYTTAFLLAELKQNPEARAALASDGNGFPGLTYQAQGY